MTAPPALRIAVLTPVLNEAGRLAGFLHALSLHDLSAVVVADGGSADDTVALASSLAASRPGVRVVTTARGRGVQVEAAARTLLSGPPPAPDVFWILHADSQPPGDAVARIREALADPRVAGGCFRLRFDMRHPVLAAYAWASRFDTPWTTFGDQGFFVRTAAWRAIGGAPAAPILEDVILRARLRRSGRFVKLDAAVTTSGRRFAREGVVRGQLRNGLVLAAFFCGAAPERLARWYRPEPAAPQQKSFEYPP